MEVKNQISNHFGFEHLPQATQSGLVCVLASLKRNEKRSQYFQDTDSRNEGRGRGVPICFIYLSCYVSWINYKEGSL